MSLEILKKWFFKNYEIEKNEIDRRVVARFARGNVLVQKGHYINRQQLVELSEKADRASVRLKEVAG